MPGKSTQAIVADNIKHKGRSIWYKATTAFDMILLYLQHHPIRTTKDTTLQDFQARITQYVDEFIPKKS